METGTESAASSSPSTPQWAGSVRRVLEGKILFITGCTGFVGKVLLEKLLRCTNPKKIFILVRARKGSTAEERMDKEVLSSEIFTRLKRERKDIDVLEWIRSKVVPIVGDLTQNECGISKKDIQMLQEECDIFFHVAAIVDFNERIDRAAEMNVLGTLRLFDIAKRCHHLGAFIHTSTCYVNSNRKGGWIDEKLYPLGFDGEKVIEQIRKAKASEMDKLTVTGMLRDWPNTYTFTKAIAEDLLVRRREKIPLAIVRPSIIGAAWKEPFPGWTDTISAAGTIYMAVGYGVLKFIPGDPHNIADIVPVDVVVNTLICTVPAIFETDRYVICHASTGVENPLRWGLPTKSVLEYFARRPVPGAISKPEFRIITSAQEYQIQLFLRYSVVSAFLNTIAPLGPKTFKEKASQFSKMVWRVRVLNESFRHFVETEWLFDNRNTRAHWQTLEPEERSVFGQGLQDLDWVQYNEYFAYGMLRFCLKNDLVEPTDEDLRKFLDINDEPWSSEKKNLLERTFYDISWTARTIRERHRFPPSRPLEEMRSLIFTSPAVQAAIKAEADASRKHTVAQVEERARGIIEKMFGEESFPVLTGMSWLFRKIWRRIYEKIRVDVEGLEMVRAAMLKGPIIYIPTHRSYVDFLIMSYICMACNLPMPHIAAGEDFLGILFVRWIFRKCGAFFIRRQFADDNLYSAIFTAYVTQLLLDGQSIEFFIEGTRSRSGKMLHPKVGLLSVITGACLTQKVDNVTIVPVGINYEKTIESDLYSSELAGNTKIQESLRNLVKSRSVLNVNFGQISVIFGRPVKMQEYIETHGEQITKHGRIPQPFQEELPDDLSLLPPSLAARAPPKKSSESWGDEDTEIEPETDAKDTKATDSEGKGFKYNPTRNKVHRKYFNRAIAYRISNQLCSLQEAMPTNLVATLMLMYRQGITRERLVSKVDWLRKEIVVRGGRLCGFTTENRSFLVKQAISHLGHLIVERRQNVLEPAISARQEYQNMLALGHYRNKIVHLFFIESLWACALYALITQGSSSKEGKGATTGGAIPKRELIKEVRFLYHLLHRECIYKSDPDEPEDFEAILATMIQRGILKSSKFPASVSTGSFSVQQAALAGILPTSAPPAGTQLMDPLPAPETLEGKRSSDCSESISVAPTGETHFSFLCALFWPFIDSYFAASMILFTLQPDRTLEEGLLVQRTQWLATTLYHESMLCFYESCSKETLSNAFYVLQKWKVIEISRVSNKKGGTTSIVKLQPPYQEEETLENLIKRIDRLRKQPPVSKGVTRGHLIADIPILAKL